MVRLCSVTTDPHQLALVTPTEQAEAYAALLSIHLDRLRAWSKLPDERTDWALEELLDDIGTAAQALRRLRGEADLPF